MTPAFDHEAMAELRKATAAAVKKRVPAAHEVVHQRLAETVSSMLDLDLTDLITSAWCNTDAIVKAADDSRRAPEPVRVSVGHQEYTTRHTAVLEASIDRFPLEPLPIGLDLELEVDSLQLTLKDGCLAEIGTGSGAITATLIIDGVALLPAVKRKLDLKKTISLQHPIPLCRPPHAERPADGPGQVVMPDARADADDQRRASPAGSPPSSDLA